MLLRFGRGAADGSGDAASIPDIRNTRNTWRGLICYSLLGVAEKSSLAIQILTREGVILITEFWSITTHNNHIISLIIIPGSMHIGLVAVHPYVASRQSSNRTKDLRFHWNPANS